MDNDITNIFKEIDLEEARKPDKKFVSFTGEKYQENPTGFSYPEDVKFKSSFVEFKTEKLECEKYHIQMGIEAAGNLLAGIQKEIDKRIEKDLRQQKLDLAIKYRKELGYDELEEKQTDLINKMLYN